MAEKGVNTMQFKVREEDFEAAHAFVADLLERRDVSSAVANEVLIVFEALFQKLLDSDLDEDTELDISWVKKLGGFNVRVGFEGKPFNLYTDSEDSIEDKVLRGYDDKLDCSYHTGYNVINITVSRNYRRRLFACAIAALLAILAYIPLHFFLEPSARLGLVNDYVFPLETAYANAALMVGAPMVFFSLLKNLTDTYVLSKRSSGVRRLQAWTLSTSVVAVLLAVVSGFLWYIPFHQFGGFGSEYGGTGLDRSFAEIVTSSVPPSIFEPFESISPIPLMLVALLVTYALCSSGKHFNTLRQAMEACYTLFSRMLHVVTAGLPAFCFLAFMDVLLTDAFWGIPVILLYFTVIYTSLLLLLAYYAVRLRVHGVKVISFARKLIPLVRENIKIGSAIDAVPYNVRYCAKTYGMNREKLDRDLPVLAQVNLDGNCFIIMLGALIFMFVTGANFTWFNTISMGVLVLLLSFGAPNQPGSILIGILIVTMSMNSFDVICAAIYLEAFLGVAQNIVNVIGDIVIATIDDRADTDSQTPLVNE